MTWNKLEPLASESLKLGDDRIRETKEEFQNAMDDEKIFPGPDPLNNPVCYDKILCDTTVNRPAASASYPGRFYVNTTTGTIQMDNGGAWIDITPPKDIFPSGSVIPFYQATAPTGWSQLTDASFEDITLRVVSTVGGSLGGTDSIKTPPTHDHDGVSGSENIDHIHLNTITTKGTAWYSGQVETTVVANSGWITATETSSSTEHTHVIVATEEFKPYYLDFILAVRV
jgi:hypothetical protein